MCPAATNSESKIGVAGEVEDGVDVGQVRSDDERRPTKAGLSPQSGRREIGADQRVCQRVQAALPLPQLVERGQHLFTVPGRLHFLEDPDQPSLRIDEEGVTRGELRALVVHH